MFRSECQTSVCLRCLGSVEHIGHTLSILSEVLESRIKIIQEDQEKLEHVLGPTYRCIACDVEAEMKQIERDYDEVLADINQHADEWRQETEQFIENVENEVLETKTKQMVALK